MSIAVIGTGIAGLVAARELAPNHEVTVFEARSRLGGHTHTVDVPIEGRVWPVDTGFIVHNPEAYPEFIRLMEELGVATRPTNMSFSVRCEESNFEWGGARTQDLLLARPRNLIDRRFWRLVRELPRFNREAQEWLAQEDQGQNDMSLSEYLRSGGYSETFVRYYVIPMAAAIWSARADKILDFPARSLIRFFQNHGVLRLTDRPVWRTLVGGSNSYLGPMTERFADRIRLSCPVKSIRRSPRGVHIQSSAGEELFEAVVLAVHSDQALSLLADPSEAESQVLGAIGYQRNEVALHTDSSILPRARGAWSSWNYHLSKDPSKAVAVTYNMNILQGLDAPETFCVTLNSGDRLDRSKVIRDLVYHHPIFDGPAIRAQSRFEEISGPQSTFYCGAYWRFGFHEDGVWSGLRAARQLAGVLA